MRVDQFDFDLPEELIALRPARPRDAARMLVVGPERALQDRIVREITEFLRPGDTIVLNDTRVIAAALAGERVRDGHRVAVSLNLLKRLGPARWSAFARPARRLKAGDRLVFRPAGVVSQLNSLEALVADRGEAGEVIVEFSSSGKDLDEAVAAFGNPPLPPYIAGKREPDEADRDDYQTVFARKEGAVAAPTAGLHLTPELLARLESMGVARHTVTLHVGAGTFLPVKADDTSGHRMHAEWGEVSEATATALNAVRQAGGRVLAVGTTVTRLLEAAADEDGMIQPFSGETDIFITPGYRFRAVDLMMTNFHLPRSTLFMLVSAFAGLETMRAAYEHAIARGYRFYSYGDASLLYPERP